MRLGTRWITPVLLTAFLFAEGTAVWARGPVLPIPSGRQPRSVVAPKSGLPKSPITSPKTKGGKSKSWFPFGNRNKK